MARLVLVGLPGVGKTTTARALAAYWRCDAIDTDDVIGEQVGMAPADFLREEGETDFRARELDALRAALSSDAVVATGAGVVTTSAARDLLATSIVFWLDSDDETLLSRVRDGERPLLGVDHRQGLARLRAEREGWYEAVSRVRVDASGSSDEVLRRILVEAERVAP
ncbi:MAG TPA: shikimate kinase [Acidimicrobiales bacterium]|nr:shikimate kinase [Acidimicrobiales bacterium]